MRLAFTPRPGRSFTLIEMIIVVAIMAILVSLLMPALGVARETARSIQCMSQLKQLGNASFYYSDDYDGWVMPSRLRSFDSHYVTPIYWQDALVTSQTGTRRGFPGYIQESGLSLTKCPSPRAAAYDIYAYAMNYILSPYDIPVYRLSQLKSPSEKIDFVDSLRGVGFPCLNYTVYIDGRHHSKANVFFFDGHCLAHAPTELDTTKNLAF